MSRERRLSFLHAAFTQHLGLKALSLFAAIVAFALVRGSADGQRVVFVDVVALLPPSGSNQLLVSEVPERLRVTVRGSQSLLNSLRPDEIPAVQMDLRSEAGAYYYFEPESIELPAGLRVVQVAPSTVTLAWAERRERRLTVEVITGSEPAEGLMLHGPPSVRPSMARVRGAANEVALLESVRTEPLDLSNLPVGRHTRRVPLVRPPNHVNYVDASSVEVTIEIEPVLEDRTLEDVEVAVVGGAGVQLRPAQVDIQLRGSPAALARLTETTVVPFVDVAGLDPEAGGQVRPVQLRGVPEGIQSSIDPGDVLVLPEAEAARSGAPEVPQRPPPRGPRRRHQEDGSEE